MSISRVIVGLVAVSALALGVAPALASAQTAPYYYGNCATYPYSTTYPYTYPYNTYGYNNGYCPQGNLFVYVQVAAPANSFYSRQPSDFSISVSGGNAYPATFPGSTNGQLISVVGSYSVTAAPFQNYTASYSNGCTGNLSQGQQGTCVITETPTNAPYNIYNYPYNIQYPYLTAPGYNMPNVYVTPTYVPRLPNTGFEPQDGLALAALAVLMAMAAFSLPYVRKALAIILG